MMIFAISIQQALQLVGLAVFVNAFVGFSKYHSTLSLGEGFLFQGSLIIDLTVAAFTGTVERHQSKMLSYQNPDFLLDASKI